MPSLYGSCHNFLARRNCNRRYYSYKLVKITFLMTDKFQEQGLGEKIYKCHNVVPENGEDGALAPLNIFFHIKPLDLSRLRPVDSGHDGNQKNSGFPPCLIEFEPGTGLNFSLELSYIRMFCTSFCYMFSFLPITT